MSIWHTPQMIGAVDIGGTKIAAGIVDRDGRVLACRECPTEAHKGLADGLERIVTMLRQAVTEAGTSLQGIGIGCTGPVHPQEGTIGVVEFLPGWEGANLVDALSQVFGVPAAIENDADAAALGEWAWGVGRSGAAALGEWAWGVGRLGAAALGEWVWGVGRSVCSFMLVTVGTGIGVGVVLDGRLYRGVQGAHPEIGHHVIDPSGSLCFCGARGCWESLASGPAMERWAQANVPRLAGFSARQLCDAAEQSDPLAAAAVQHTARYLGLGLANLVTLFVPDVIALGGGLTQSLHLFMPTITETIRTNCGLVPYQQVQVVPAVLGIQTGLVGAAQVWYNRYTLD